MYAETTERPSENFARNVLNSSDITRLFHQNPLGGDLQTPRRGLKGKKKSFVNKECIGENLKELLNKYDEFAKPNAIFLALMAFVCLIFRNFAPDFQSPPRGF